MKSPISDYLYQKASIMKIPLFGCLELSPVCNFSCKMCYVRKTKEQIAKEGKRIKEWKEWVALAEQMKEEGTLFLLLSGGEPFIYPNFKELYMTLHKMNFVLSINSNGTMIDEATVEWLKEAAPARINITLYGASRETYGKICGNPDGYNRTIRAIHLLKEAGIPVVINASMIPENEHDMKAIIEFGKSIKTNTRVSTYMFPPVRREQEKTDSRFTPTKAAEISMYKYKCQFGEEEYLDYIKKAMDSISKDGEEMIEHRGKNRGEAMKCKAGRSTFWISWDGTMSACGLVPFPLQVYPFEEPFKDCWLKLTDSVREAIVLKECQGCDRKDICQPCVAMAYAETGDVNAMPLYLCQMTEKKIEIMENDLAKLEGK